MSPEERNARAVGKAAAYRRRMADGTAEPLEEFLAENQDLRDLLEPMFDEAQAVTQSVAPAQEPGFATMLPDTLQQEILAIHSGSPEAHTAKIEEL